MIVCLSVGACGSVCLEVFVRWNPTIQLFVFSVLDAAAAAAAVSCRRLIPSLKLSSSSRLCGRHGTTAVAHQVCVDHYLLYMC